MTNDSRGAPNFDPEILPYRGTGPVRFGMTKADVLRLLGQPDKEFVRSTQFAPDLSEWIYGDGRLFLIFDRDSKCVEIMLTPPATALLSGVRLLSMGAAEAWAELRRMDASAFVDENGCLTSKKLGVNIHAPDVETEFEEPGVPALSVLVFNDPEDERLQGRSLLRRKPAGRKGQ